MPPAVLGLARKCTICLILIDMRTSVCYNGSTYVGTPMLEVIGEAIRVCAYFQQGRICPLWFDWKGRRYRVEDVRSRWVRNEGIGRRYYFAVTVGGRADLYEICFRSETMDWQLGRIDVSE